jgi:hypothetical protein
MHRYALRRLIAPLRLFGAVLACLPAFVQAATYYVATDGDDADPGTQTRPWRTIQKAADTLVAGDAVYVRGGTYRERVIARNSGNPGAYIAYLAYPGEQAVVDGQGIDIPDYGALLELSDRSYVKVSGFTVMNAGPNGYSVGILSDGGSHVVIEKNHTINTASSGIAAWGAGDHVEILDNEVETCVNGGHSECLSVAGTGFFEVARNHVHHTGPKNVGAGSGGEGICLKDGAHDGAAHDNHVHDANSVGVYVDAWDKRTHDILVYRNRVHAIVDYGGGLGGNGIALASENGGLLENVRVYDNLSYRNGYNGLMVGGYGDPVPHRPIEKIEIVNNTFHGNGAPEWGGGILLDNAELKEAIVRNNLVSQNSVWQIYALETIPTENYRIDHNLIDGFRGSQPQETRGESFVEGEARFVDAAGEDFHLLKDSPAIDAGFAANAPSEDFDGLARPQGAAYDIGAYEYAADVPPASFKWLLWSDSVTHLRGANIYQRRVYPELDGPNVLGPGPLGPPYTQADFDRLAALHVNYVNISHPGLYAEKPPYALDREVEDNLDRLIDMARKAGLYAVIAFRTGPGRSEFTFLLDGLDDWFDASYLNDRVWVDADAQEAWAAMWRHAAARYRDRANVAGYDLMVEPNGNQVGGDYLNDRLDIWDPDEFRARYGGSAYDWNAWYPRLVRAIRAEDADTPILVEPMAYANIDWLPYLQPTDDAHSVYSIHQYAPFQYTHQAQGRRTCPYPGKCDVYGDGHRRRFDGAWLERLLAPAAEFRATHGVPVAIGEYGVHRWAPGAAAYLRDEMDRFERLGVNYALWMWYPEWPPLREIDSAFNFRLGANPASRREVASSPAWKALRGFWDKNAQGGVNALRKP